MSLKSRCCAALGAALLAVGLGGAPSAQALSWQKSTVNGLVVDLFTWRDSQGLIRTAALKRQGEGNPGNGGYAVRMTYQYRNAQGQVVNAVADATAGEGFGYFVSHERYRSFTDGSSNTIAGKIFGKDDSPLGRSFPVRATPYPIRRDGFAGIVYRLEYPRYGTKAPNGIDPDTGEDSPKLGTSQALYELYQLPVWIYWIFEDGRDYPRIRNIVSLANVPGPDRVSFDMRGPYGVLNFDGGANPIKQVMWGDRYQFLSANPPLTRNSTWTWNLVNNGARYTSLSAGRAEMGILEPIRYRNSRTNDGYSTGRNRTSATHNQAAAGCPDQELPCDYEWPYQSAQYSLPYDNPNGSTTYEKIAWGTTAFYGTSLASTYDGTQSTPFVGFPDVKYVYYDTCVVIGQQVTGGLTRLTALNGGTYNCAGLQ